MNGTADMPDSCGFQQKQQGMSTEAPQKHTQRGGPHPPCLAGAPGASHTRSPRGAQDLAVLQFNSIYGVDLRLPSSASPKRPSGQWVCAKLLRQGRQSSPLARYWSWKAKACRLLWCCVMSSCLISSADAPDMRALPATGGAAKGAQRTRFVDMQEGAGQGWAAQCCIEPSAAMQLA